jgi:hypothetical protein
MRRIIILAFTLLLNKLGIAQSCSGGDPIICGNKKVISPAVAKPANVSLASATCSMLQAKWKGSAGQEYELTATYTDPATNTTETITGISITNDANQNFTANIPVKPGTKVSYSIEAKGMIGTCPFYSYPATTTLDYPIADCNQAGKTVAFAGKVMLQGALNATTGLMNNALNTLGILQEHASNQPYKSSGFNYIGTESVAQGFFAAHPDIVDWVLLELRDPNVPATVVATRAAFVKQDGTLVETDGTTTAISFPNIASANYYVTVKHRNHLAIRSTTPLNFTNGSADYDFTTANYKSFKNQPYPSPVQMGTVWVMRGGNANTIQNTKYTGPGNDQNQILNAKLGGSLSLILNNV